MPHYIVRTVYCTTFEAEVEADSSAEAREKAVHIGREIECQLDSEFVYELREEHVNNEQ